MSRNPNQIGESFATDASFAIKGAKRYWSARPHFLFRGDLTRTRRPALERLTVHDDRLTAARRARPTGRTEISSNRPFLNTFDQNVTTSRIRAFAERCRLWVMSRSAGLPASLPLYPRQRTSPRAWVMSAWWANIPPKKNRGNPIATRYDRLAANYLAFTKRASIRLWIRAHESTPKLLIRGERRDICMNKCGSLVPHRVSIWPLLD